MLIVIYILISIPVIIYCLLVWKWSQAWRRTPSFVASNQGAEPLSVVICLHNEEENARQVVNMIERNIASDDIILVCDHCTDRTPDILRSLTKDMPRVRVIDNDMVQGKKFAQRYGVMQAKHNYVAFTDADCMVPKDWDLEVGECIYRTGAQLVISPVVMRAPKSDFLGHLFELEFLSLQMSTAGSALAGDPIMCNGANLAVNSLTYLDHDALTEYVSGDDMFLLASVKSKGGRIEYLKSRHALVNTSTPATLAAFWRQRTRWLRKSTGYTDASVVKAATTVFAANIIWAALAVLATVGLCHWVVPVVLFVLKTVFDMQILYAGGRFWCIKTDFWSMLCLAVVYPLMTCIVAVRSIFRSKNKW